MSCRVHLDYETRSELDIKKVGAGTYARHPSTEIMSLAYAVDNGPVKHLDEYELEDELETLELRLLANDPAVIFVAHNAMFEQLIWRNCMTFIAPCPPTQRWRCTAAKAAAMALPRRLGQVAETLRLAVQKDTDGGKAMMKLTKPRRPSQTDPDQYWRHRTALDDFAAMYKYNVIDVETERLVDHALPDLSAFEQRVWEIDQQINMRGVFIDVRAVKRAIELMEIHKERLQEEFKLLTCLDVDSPTQRVKFIRHLKIFHNITLPDTQSATLQRLADHPKSNPTVKRLCEILLELGKAASKKYQAMLNRHCDGVLTDLFLYCAASTGRWGGRGVQLHNLKRPTVDGEAVAQSLLSQESYEKFTEQFGKQFGKFNDAISSGVRSMIRAREGYEFVAADYSGIEARVLAWVAGQADKLDLFRRNEEFYCRAAEQIYGYPVTKKANPDERQVGKVSELALGYEGGIGAFGQMAKGYGVKLEPIYGHLINTVSEEEKERAENAYKLYKSRTKTGQLSYKAAFASDIIKQRWRRSNQRIVKFWIDVRDAAIRAVETGEQVLVGASSFDRPTIVFFVENDFLMCRLPSGRCLAYYKPKVTEKKTPWGDMKPALSFSNANSVTGKVESTGAYGGLLTENIVQAISRDILAYAIVKVTEAGHQVAMHVHDEIVIETPEGQCSVEELEQLMLDLPDWARGLPLNAEGWKGKRYRK